MVKVKSNPVIALAECSLRISGMKEYCGKRFDINGCAILFIERGFAICKINHQRFSMCKGYLGVLFYDDTVYFESVSNAFRCITIMVPYNLVEEPIYKVTTSGLWNFIYKCPVFPLNDRQLFQIRAWWQQILWVTNNVIDRYKLEVLKNNIHNLFMVINSELRIADNDISQMEDNRARMLVTNFLELVAKYHPDYRDVSFYADKLCISPSYLYKNTYSVLGVSPKRLIDRQVSAAIKNYLMTTDLTDKTIASQLHFKDSSYMCRFFRRMEGVSPQEYRNTMNNKSTYYYG